MKNKNQLLYFSYLLVIVILMLFEVLLYPIMCLNRLDSFFANFFSSVFSQQMFISFVAIGVGACMLSKKARAWSVRFLTVFLSFAIFDLFIRTGSIMSRFFNCLNYSNSSLKTWIILESVFYILSIGQFIAVLIITKPWEVYVLGFKSIDAIENELDLEQVNQEIKELEK